MRYEDAFGIEWSDEHPELAAIARDAGTAGRLLATRYWGPYAGAPLAVIVEDEKDDGREVDAAIRRLEEAGWVVSRRHQHERKAVPGGTLSGHWHAAMVYGLRGEG